MPLSRHQFAWLPATLICLLNKAHTSVADSKELSANTGFLLVFIYAY